MALAIRDVEERDLDAVLALNNTAGAGILATDPARLRLPFDQAHYFRVAEMNGVIAGLLCSLRVRRRRFWLRAIPASDGDPDGRTVVMAAGLARSDVDGFSGELEDLVGRIAGEPPGTTSTEKE